MKAKLIAALVLVCIVWLLALIPYNMGKNKVQAQWDAAQVVHLQAITDAQTKYNKLEGEHSALTRQIEEKEQINATQSKESIAAIEREYAGRLLNADKRAGIYQRKAEAGAIEQRNLAEHAAQLDRAIEDGLRVVGVLETTIRERDGTIRNLAEQIRTDRKVLESP